MVKIQATGGNDEAQLTGNRTIYAIKVEHMAIMNTILRALSYESQAALCRSGGNETTSFADCLILLIVWREL